MIHLHTMRLHVPEPPGHEPNSPPTTPPGEEPGREIDLPPPVEPGEIGDPIPPNNPPEPDPGQVPPPMH